MGCTGPHPSPGSRAGDQRNRAFTLDHDPCSMGHGGGKHPAHGPLTQQLAESVQDAARETIKLYPRHEVDFALLQLEVRALVKSSSFS